MAKKYQVTEEALWHYMITALRSPTLKDITPENIVPLLHLLRQTERAITAVDGRVKLLDIVKALTFTYEDYMRNPLPVKVPCYLIGSKMRECSPEMFGTILTDYGNCVTFQPPNSGPFVQTRSSYLKGGLYSHFYLHSNESSGE